MPELLSLLAHHWFICNTANLCSPYPDLKTHTCAQTHWHHWHGVLLSFESRFHLRNTVYMYGVDMEKDTSMTVLLIWTAGLVEALWFEEVSLITTVHVVEE